MGEVCRDVDHAGGHGGIPAAFDGVGVGINIVDGVTKCLVFAFEVRVDPGYRGGGRDFFRFGGDGDVRFRGDPDGYVDGGFLVGERNDSRVVRDPFRGGPVGMAIEPDDPGERERAAERESRDVESREVREGYVRTGVGV